jgi:hypothetical protein
VFKDAHRIVGPLRRGIGRQLDAGDEVALIFFRRNEVGQFRKATATRPTVAAKTSMARPVRFKMATTQRS